MEINTKQEKIWRQFLLGDVTETERAAIEDAFLADEENLVRLEIVEDELIEDYLHGDLTGAEKSLFESEFLRTAGRRERVARMQILIDETTARKRVTVSTPEKISWSETVAAFFKNAAWQTAFAASVLITLAAFGAWLFNRQNVNQPEIVKTEPTILQSPAPVPSPEATAPENTNLPNANQNKSNSAPKPSPTATPEKPQPPKERETTLAIFILNPGGIRGGAAENRLRVPPQTREIRLRLNLESNNYQSYTARVTTIDGATIYTSPQLKSNRKSLLLQLPIRKLQPGDYIVELSGINAAGQTESVDDYAFTLQK